MRLKQYTHGEAVIYGIFVILEFSYQRELISYSYYRLSLDLLDKYGFKPLKQKYLPQKLTEIMRKDKKATGDYITFIVPSDKKHVKEIKLAPVEVEQLLSDILNRA